MRGTTGRSAAADRGPEAPWPVAALGAALAAAGGLRLLGDGSPGALSGGVLLLIVALVLGAVALGGARYGPEVEGRLDLSARLGLGILGGVLGALAAVVAGELLEGLRVVSAAGVTLPGEPGPAGVGAGLLRGAVWGMALGVVLPWVPGPDPAARGAAFSLLPSLYALLKVFPLDLDLGFFGARLGTLAFLFVLLLNGIWGLVAGWVVGWGGRTGEAPLSRPLGE